MRRQNWELAALEFELSRVPGVGLDICYLILSHKHETNKNLNGSQFLACYSWDFVVSSTLKKKKKDQQVAILQTESEVQNG